MGVSCHYKALYQALGNDFRGHNQCERIRHGIMCASFVQKAGLVSHLDVKKLNGKDVLPKAIAADAKVGKLWDLIQASQHANDPLVIGVFNDFQMAVSLNLVGKQTTWVSQFLESHKVKAIHYEEHGHLYTDILGWWAVECIEQITESRLTDNFDAAEVAENDETPEAQAAGPQGVRTANDRNDHTANMMVEAGWSIGGLVYNKRNKDYDGKIFKIQSWSEGFVELHDIKSSLKIAETVENFQAKHWSASKAVNQEWVMKAGNVQVVEETDAWKLNVIQAKAMQTIIDTIPAQSNVGSLRVCIKGGKVVEATSDIPNGKLLIVPVTTKVKTTQVSQVPVDVKHYSSSALFLGCFNIGLQSYTCSLGSMQSQNSEGVGKKPGVLSPFWYLDTSEEQKDCNCALTTMCKVSPKINIDNPSFKIPCIKNIKAIKAGSKLVLWLPSGEPAKKKQKKG
jgi:hypothetical protein